MWTPQQKQAIDSEGKNIIVSAGAGSGKTAVLTTRIVEKIKRGCDITSLLVLTFTKAAASEMKERVRKNLLEIGGFEKALEKLDQAYITTFDSFSLSMVKKYFYKLNVKPDITIADSLVIKKIKQDIINEVLMEHYNAFDIKLEAFLRSFTAKDDVKLQKLILSALQQVDLKIDTINYLDTYVANHFSQSYIENIIRDFEADLIIDCKNLAFDAKNLHSSLDSGKLSEYLSELIDTLNAIESYEEAVTVFSNIKVPAVNRGSSDEIKTAKADFVKGINKISDELLIYEDTSSMTEGILLSEETTKFLIDITKECYLRIKEYKHKEDYYEFIDIAKMSIDLVTNYPDARDEIKQLYSEILIDEYQDTSDLQEAFIEQIANNNLYMVGDIKQSIYRFRNANPYIFKQKYEDYSKSNGGIKIDLTKNFRSRRQVLENINLIFNDIMSDDYGDARYKESHQMSFGFTKYDDYEGNCNYDMEIIRYQSNPEYKMYSVAEIEAFIIADDLLKRMETMIVYDNEIKNKRKVKFSDFCILIDKTTHFETIKKIFEYKGIPLAINADYDLSNSILSKIICNLLNVIAKIYHKKLDASYFHSFTSVARSFIMEYSDEQIYQYVMTKDCTNDLYLWALELSEQIDKIAISQIYEKALRKFKVYESLPKVGNINDSLVQLEYLDNLIINLEGLGYSFSELTEYLSEILNADEKISYSVMENMDNCVKMMTIHKSKGLEFPICYFPLLQVKFNIRDLTSEFSFSNKYGFICPIDQDGIEKTIVNRVSYKRSIKEEISEHIRLFYVALTRAKEKFIMINQFLNYSEKYLLPQNFLSFGHFIFSLNDKLVDYCRDISIDGLGLSKNYLNKLNSNEIPKGSMTISYPTFNIENKLIKKERISKSIDKLASDKTLANIKLGLEFHEALEALDFNNADVNSLSCSQFIKDRLNALLGSELFLKIKEAKTYHEHEFETIIESKKYHGIIDLLVIYSDHIDIIDYKLSNLDHEEYSRQLGIYKAYVEQKSSLPVNLYLLAVLSGEIKKIEI